MNLLKEVNNYLMKNLSYLFRDDLTTCYYAYSTVNKKQMRVFDINDKLTIFLKHKDDIHKIENDSTISFNDKLEILGYDSDGAWVKVSIRVLYDISKKYELVHPSSLISTNTPEGIHINVAN